MYSPSLFAAVPVALFLVTCSNPSAALVVGNRHHASTKNKTMSALRIGGPRRTRTKHVVAQPAQPQPQRRDVNDPLTTNLEAYLSDLTLYHNNILAASDAFCETCFHLCASALTPPNSMAASSAQNARSNSDENSRREAAEHLASYKETLGSLYPLFAHIGADKGLANYDKSDQYETLLKDIVNATKNTLGGTSSLVDAIPVIGPLLGPSKLVHLSLPSPPDPSPFVT
jgi:hypothetical protein